MLLFLRDAFSTVMLCCTKIYCAFISLPSFGLYFLIYHHKQHHCHVTIAYGYIGTCASSFLIWNGYLTWWFAPNIWNISASAAHLSVQKVWSMSDPFRQFLLLVLIFFPPFPDCLYGSYGVECRNTCNCKGGICDRETGACLTLKFFAKIASKLKTESQAGEKDRRFLKPIYKMFF